MERREGKPRIGITIGDAAGIGPEIALRAAASERVIAKCAPILIGDRSHLAKVANRLGMGDPAAALLDDAIDTGKLPAETPLGRDDAATGKAAAECIERAVAAWKGGEIDAIATAPISKNAIKLGGYDFPGHTEFLAKLTGTDRFAMSFFAGDLRVVLLSTHVSLRDAIELVTPDRLTNLIRFADQQLRRLLRRDVSIAVAGLNPHASEGGMFGTEEAERITPAIDACRRDHGIDVRGPFSPDTIFLRGSRGEFDAVIALYHDQATIAVKSLAFGEGVNVTLGLPLIRTSVDHGTAYDIAGTGTADASSMIAAVRLAAELAS